MPALKLLRAAVLLLVLANLLFFAWGQGYFGDIDEGREPKRLTNQLSPEKLRVTPAVTPSAAPQACRLLAGLSADDLQRLKALAGEKAPGLEFVARSNQASPAYWLLIAQMPDRQTAEKKLLELKRLGLSDATVKQDEDPNRFIIPFGIFNSEQAAQDQLKALVKRGVRSAEVQVRKKAGQLLARGPADLLAKRLPELLSTFPAASISECPVDH